MYTCCISRLKPMNPKSTKPLSTKTRLVILVLSSAAALPSSLRPTGQSYQPCPSGKSDQTGQAKARAPQNNGPFEKAFLALMNQEIANGKGHETVGFNPILISLPNKPFTPREPLPISARKTDCKGVRKKHWAMLKSRLKCTPVMAY